MTTQEFKIEYDKLAKVYPYDFGNEYKERAIYNFVKDLEKKWWAALVNRILLSSNPKLNIEDAARGERLARKQIELTNDLIQSSQILSDQITDQGYNDALERFGAKSLLEAVFKKGI